MFINKLKISQKLPIIIVGLALLSSVTTGFITITRAEKDALHESELKLVGIETSRQESLNNYLHSITEDLQTLSRNDYVRKALIDFENGWNDLGSQKAEVLQKLYINENPNPTGKKEELDYAPDGSLYSKVHHHYHDWFRFFLRQREYYDIFLFNLNGDLIYSVFKGLDYATNMNSGIYKDTDLANAFRAALNGKDPAEQHFFDFKPYAPSHGAPASFISQGVYDRKGTLIGVLAFQMPVGRINAIMQLADGMGETGQSYIVGTDGFMRSQSRFTEEQTILKTKVNDEAIKFAIENNKSYVHEFVDHRGVRVVSAQGPVHFLGTDWVIIAEMNEDEVMKPVNDMKSFAISATAGALLVIMLMAIFASRMIAKPITIMTTAMNEIAKGNFGVEIPGAGRKDEIGAMANSVVVFKENGLEAIRLKEEQERAAIRAEEDKKKAMYALADQFDTQVGGTIKSLADAAEQLQEAAVNMAAAANETQTASVSVASASEETSVNVQTVAAATEEMTVASQEISKQVSDVAAKASMASDNANRTSKQVNELNGLVENIGSVVFAIKDIADQTNLLALNATIEAARAGEAGKGFAVVADEVKKLANETAQKTEEIKRRITEIQNATQSAVQAMQEIIRNISDIDGLSANAAGAVEEQNATTAEITRNIAEVSQASSKVANVIGSVQQAATDTGKAAQMLRGCADNIATLSSNLDASVHDFLNEIRSDDKKSAKATLIAAK